MRDGRASIDDIVRLVNDLGGDASRSAVGRYVKSAREKLEQYREAQEIAKVWVGKLEENPEGDVGRLLSEMLRTVAFQTIGAMGETKTARADQVMFLAKAIRELAAADKTSMERELRIRKEVLAEVGAKVADVGSRHGLTAAAQKDLKRELLGIVA